MTIEEMRKRKKELGYTYERISELSGVPLGTVQKVFAGVTTSPRYDTLQALEQIFIRPSGVGEPALYRPSKMPEDYRLEDDCQMPEERRAELIEGVFYDMPASTPGHQMIATEIWSQLKAHIREAGGDCIPLVAPVDVCLDEDDLTVVQPDVLVICDRQRIREQCVYGAPDLVVEILSQSTRRKDSIVKLDKYMRAGVKEYWMVDEEKRRVLVYDFRHEDYPAIYGFQEQVPVGIFAGQCRIDFVEIYDYVRFFYE